MRVYTHQHRLDAFHFSSFWLSKAWSRCETRARRRRKCAIVRHVQQEEDTPNVF